MAQTELTDDESLVGAARDGDHRAFALIYSRYRDPIAAICARRLGNPLDVEDAVQETFLKAFRGLGRMQYENLGGWLARIAMRVCIDRLRQENRRPATVPLLESTDVSVAPGPDHGATTWDERVDRALLGLSELHRRAVVLRFVFGFSHVEMGEVLKRSPSQIKALVHRAKAKLHADLAAA